MVEPVDLSKSNIPQDERSPFSSEDAHAGLDRALLESYTRLKHSFYDNWPFLFQGELCFLQRSTYYTFDPVRLIKSTIQGISRYCAMYIRHYTLYSTSSTGFSLLRVD